ncbi:hypothetical protein K3G63_19695 [Hymenobacter sp. HSC-4F20]|uniref:hypothetical protein n=1 Tax=Hymenobacter sp. HSC-4F20 TaxID=2864135 RepID=UPI001C72AD30|nr:hypothetical protein [Hymenobacter sp. HSC-4F20]MBX0292678.1 hypothetical protein [Hymenobacter sp. HSC-4F20]
MQTLRVLAGSAAVGVCLGHYAHAQVAAPDSAFLATARTLAEQRYTAAIRDQSKLYNGSEYFNYTRYYQEVTGDQFFISAQEAPNGTVDYDGQVYTAVPLLYDIRLDQVVVKQPTSSFYLQLISERVRQFSLHGHTFVRLVRDSTVSQDVRPGFYDLLLDQSGVRVLARRTKKMQTQPSQGITRAEFYPYTYYFIELNNAYHSVKSKGSVISLFPAQRKALQQFARDRRLAFTKETREADILQLVSYYAGLPGANSPGAAR